MKIILSRKGFDSTAGGTASPIFEDGSMVSVPIPEYESKIRYADVRCPIPGFESLGDLVTRLPGARAKASDGVHLDPDLHHGSLARLPEWRPVFGQTDKAQKHLANNGVSVGDIFVMYGWYREVERYDGGLRFVRGAPDMHVIFGWMQIGEILPIGARASGVPSWAKYHPHAEPFHYDEANTLYVASQTLELPNLSRPLPGADVLHQYHEARRLTKGGSRLRSVWSLPTWFDPERCPEPMTFHNDKARWTKHDDRVELRTVGRGQEFIFDTGVYPEALDWLASILTA